VVKDRDPVGGGDGGVVGGTGTGVVVDQGGVDRVVDEGVVSGRRRKKRKEEEAWCVLMVVWCLRVGLRPTSAGLVGLRPKPCVVLLDRHMTGM
jgi:hypothetical protein